MGTVLAHCVNKAVLVPKVWRHFLRMTSLLAFWSDLQYIWRVFTHLSSYQPCKFIGYWNKTKCFRQKKFNSLRIKTTSKSLRISRGHFPLREREMAEKQEFSLEVFFRVSYDRLYSWLVWDSLHSWWFTSWLRHRTLYSVIHENELRRRGCPSTLLAASSLTLLACALYPNFTASNAAYKTWDINMAAVYWETNMAAVTSCENSLYPIVLGCPSIIWWGVLSTRMPQIIN